MASHRPTDLSAGQRRRPRRRRGTRRGRRRAPQRRGRLREAEAPAALTERVASLQLADLRAGVLQLLSPSRRGGGPGLVSFGPGTTHGRRFPRGHRRGGKGTPGLSAACAPWWRMIAAAGPRRRGRRGRRAPSAAAPQAPQRQPPGCARDLGEVLFLVLGQQQLAKLIGAALDPGTTHQPAFLRRRYSDRNDCSASMSLNGASSARRKNARCGASAPVSKARTRGAAGLAHAPGRRAP